MKNKKWFNKWSLIAFILSLILVAIFINGFNDSLSTLKIFYLLCKDNIIISLCAMVIIIIFSLWMQNYKFITVVSMREGRIILIISLILNFFLLFYRGHVDMTSVEKHQIHAIYKQDFDSTKRVLKADYKISEKKLKNEIAELKDSNKVLLAKQQEVRESEKIIVGQNCDDQIASLTKDNEDLKDQLSSIKDDKKSETKLEPKDEVLVGSSKPTKKVAKKKPCPPTDRKLSVGYTSPGTIKYTGRKY